MARRAGRPKSGEAGLTRERILDAALRLADEGGMAVLSMRGLAKELGVDPMAIYHHLPNKEAVISGIVGSVFAEMRVPQAEGDWREQVRSFARAYRDLARAHPNLVREIVTGFGAAEATLAVGEPLYAALEGAGFSSRMVARAADLVVDYVNGFALAEVAGPLGRPEDRRELLALLESQSEGSVPAMRRVFGALSEEELPADFEFGLDVLISGLEATATGDETSYRSRS